MGRSGVRLRGITKFRFSRKQPPTARGTPSLSKRFGRLWSRRDLMWWRLTAGIISDRSLPRIAVCAAGYPWSSCLRALARMNLALGGRKPSSGESPVCILPHSSAGSVTSSIWLNLGCRANESLPDTMWSITTISAKRRKRSEVRGSESQTEIRASGELLSRLSAVYREEESSKAHSSLRRISTTGRKSEPEVTTSVQRQRAVGPCALR